MYQCDTAVGALGLFTDVGLPTEYRYSSLWVLNVTTYTSKLFSGFFYCCLCDSPTQPDVASIHITLSPFLCTISLPEDRLMLTTAADV